MNNNLQNNSQKSSSVQSNPVPHYKSINRESVWEKLDGERHSETLKIFLESGSVNPERRFNIRKISKRKALRDFQTEKCLLEEKNKGRREGRKSRKLDSVKVLCKKSGLLDAIDKKISKDKLKLKIKPPIEQSNLCKTDSKVHDTTEKNKRKTGLENSHNTILNTLYAIRKDNLEDVRKPLIIRPELCLMDPPSQKIQQKPSLKTFIPNKLPEVKTTFSDYKKTHINEILKGHAQKVQINPSKTNQQVNSFLGVNELLQKVKNITRNEITTEGKDECKKETKAKVEESEKKKNEDEKVDSEKTKEPEKVKEISFNETEEKRKVPMKWLSVPQSNELERRLKGYGQESSALFPKDKDSEEEDKKSKKPEDGSDKSSVKSKEDEKKGEKRTTYIDQLVMKRTLVKENEDKASLVNDGVEQKKMKTSETTGSIVRKADTMKIIPLLEPKTLNSEYTKEMVHDSRDITVLKDNSNPNEQIFKTKSTRSTELRDLVTQAIKEHKIFCIFDSHWYIARPVREELLSRGWLEVIPDRRLIPRRRPPPMGPSYDRDKTAIDRNNCNTIEAILTAKEAFADEIQETVSKSSSFKSTIEKPKPIINPVPAKKSSDDSLVEVLSQFRIIPPTSEKKKNNVEIREFVTKCQTLLDKDKDKKGKEKEKDKDKDKASKSGKKDKGKASEVNAEQNKTQKKPGDKPGDVPEVSVPTPLTPSLQAILDTINDNRKTIIQATTELRKLDGKSEASDPLGLLYHQPRKALACIESKEDHENNQKAVQSEKPGKLLYSEADAKMISRIIQSTNTRIHFMWLSIKPAIHLKCFNYSPEIVNKFQKTTFCTKIGLWNHLNNIQWYAHEVHFPAKSPRMYNTGEADDLQAFFQDFQLTACIGMLKWLSDTFFDRGIKAVQTKKGKVPLKAFEFAIKQCERYVRFKDNEDLSIIDEPKVLQEEWNTFLQWFYIITNDHGKVQECSSAQLMVVYTKAVETLRTMKKHWPEIDIDGRLNIWIMKPYCASCGRGIFMTNNVYYIGQHSKYIVQKYIERPLLIYNTKFDIRQWFMVTKLTPLEIWMYKECYLRFCTQPFALRNLHESVHLSNNSVQRKYVSVRDSSLPDQNMWDSNTFQLYLKSIGHPDAWENIIYPGMKDAIVSTMLAAQDTFDGPRRSWFEVYGADFMISANVKDGPWLIEINENPAMDPSTKVTARLCPQMLRDVIKVVVDKKSNKNASTGQWELVYRQNYSPSFGSVDLDVKGKKIARLPHPVKMNLNLPPLRSVVPQTHGTVDSDFKKYEIVKSLSTGTNNKKETSVLKPVEKEKVRYVKESDIIKRSEPYTKKTKKEENIDEKQKTQDRTREVSEEKNKHLSMVMSLMERQKVRQMRDYSMANFAQKYKKPEDGKETLMSNYNYGVESKKTDGSQNQSISQTDKFKFTKFYKV